MINALLAILTRWIPLRGHEWVFLGICVVGAGIIWYQNGAHDRLQEKQVLTEQALSVAKQVTEFEETSHQIDLDVIATWTRQREAYQKEQQEIIDTTFLDYFQVSDIEEPTDVSAPPAPDPPDDDIKAVVSQGIDANKLDVLARGMWDNYCTASPDAPDCTP